MVRNAFIIVSDDQLLIQKAQGFGQMHGVTVEVWSPAQYESMTNMSSNGGSVVPSLVPGHGHVETGKVLPFPGNFGSAGSQGAQQMPRDMNMKQSVSTINQMESVAIENAILAFKGNLTEAAKALGIGRATLYRKVKQYNIDPSLARKKKVA